MRTDNVIKREGFSAFAERLDPVELERFIVLLNREKFDYTKWRKDLFEDMTIEQISEEAEKFSAGLEKNNIRRTAMNAIKKSYNEIPETINVPEEFINKKGEIIFIVEDEEQPVRRKTLKDFYGAIPDFPERAVQE